VTEVAEGVAPAGATVRDARIRRGSLHLDVRLYDTYFRGLDNVVLVYRDGRMLVMPVHDPAAGGLFLKVRNARGDRVVHVAEFLRAHGFDEHLDAACPIAWDPGLHALGVRLPAPTEERPS